MNNLKKKMPKLETELIDAINVWENEHAQAFHVDVSSEKVVFGVFITLAKTN